MTILLKAISDSDTTLMFSEAPLFPQDSGVIQIDSEIIFYTTIYMNTMYGCTRGARSTSAASHPINSVISLVDNFDANTAPDSGITQLTGDVAAGPGSGSQSATLANTAVTPGAYTLTNLTVDAKGRITAAVSGSAPDTGITQLTGDVTAGPGNGSQAAALSNTAVTPGSYTSADITVDAKGRITAAASGSSADFGAVPEDILPDTDNAYDLGSDSFSWSDAFLQGQLHCASIKPLNDVEVDVYDASDNLILAVTATGLQTIDGSAASPSYSFSSDPNTGIYRFADGQTTIASNGVNKFSIYTDGVAVHGASSTLSLDALGSAATPAIYIGGDSNTGIFSTGDGDFNIASNGTEILRINSLGLTTIDGTASNPAYSFATQPLAGMTLAEGNGGPGTYAVAMVASGTLVNVFDANGLSGTSDNGGLFLQSKVSSAAPVSQVEMLSADNKISLKSDGTVSGQFDKSVAAGETRFLLYDVDSGLVQRVKVTANDAVIGVTGRVLYIDNI